MKFQRLMIRISGYIISLFLILIPHNIRAQEEEELPEQEVVLEPGLRIGFNLVRSMMVFAEPSRFGLEVVADYNVGPDWFAATESGFSRRFLNEPDYRLNENGLFFRFGADRNFHNHLNDVIALGGRLGFSVYNRKSPYLEVGDNYWGDFSGTLPAETFFSQWAEVVLTLKTELFSNVFLGWSLRGKVHLFGGNDRHMENRYIPGFGASSVNSTAGFDFYIYYRIPFNL